MGIEVWKDIKGYENKYQVSNYGKVKSLNYRRTGEDKLLKLQNDKDGYLVVNLSKNGKLKNVKVHRLVALTFIKNTNNYKIINHKDENKHNNNYNNLEWCTQSYNNLYGTHISKITKKIICMETKEVFFSIKEAANKYKINGSDICSCCKKRLKTAGGYTWKYIEEE